MSEPRAGLASIAHMPTIELTEMELMEAARGARILMRQALADAERMGATSSRKIFEEAAERHQRQADRFEALANSAQTHQKSSSRR